MTNLVKRGDTRHDIDIPATRDVEAQAGNIFGIAYEEAITAPEAEAEVEPARAQDVDALDADLAASAKKRFNWLRMPLFIRLWGRS